MRCQTQGERDACVRIETHGRPGIVNATAAPAAGRKREEGGKYDRAEYELEFASFAQQSKQRRKCE
jgi:hypothetical protein